MTPEQLIAEGRALERPCVFLRPEGVGRPAALWHPRDPRAMKAAGERCWITVHGAQVPGLGSSVAGGVRVFTDEREGLGGRVELGAPWPVWDGVPLYAHQASVLPPIEAVFARGSQAVGDWVQSYGWERSDRYSHGFGGDAVVRQYERVWQQEFPLFTHNDVYAVLGGWHWPGPDDDWHDLIDDQLLVLTIHDSEPWVEAWRTQAGPLRVIQRIT